MLDCRRRQDRSRSEVVPVLFDINDPSYSKSGVYWQLDTVRESAEKDQWNGVLRHINGGVPQRERALFNCTQPVTDPEIWGAIKEQGITWAYRIFLTGRDPIDRPGRYFVLLGRLESLSAAEVAEFTAVAVRLASVRSIPLALDHIDGRPSTVTDALFGSGPASGFSGSLRERLGRLEGGGHVAWLVNNEGVVNRLDLTVEPTCGGLPNPVRTPSSVKSKTPSSSHASPSQSTTEDNRPKKLSTSPSMPAMTRPDQSVRSSVSSPASGRSTSDGVARFFAVVALLASIVAFIVAVTALRSANDSSNPKDEIPAAVKLKLATQEDQIERLERRIYQLENQLGKRDDRLKPFSKDGSIPGGSDDDREEPGADKGSSDKKGKRGLFRF